MSRALTAPRKNSSRRYWSRSTGVTCLFGLLSGVSCSDKASSNDPDSARGGSGTAGDSGWVASPSSAGASYETGALRAAAKRAGKLFGVAVDADALRGDIHYATLLGQEFDYLTPENAMKWGPLAPTATSYAFDDADAIVAYAGTHQQRVKGHALVWHNQLPSWLNESMSAEELRAALKNHIETTLKRYRGKVRAWDVVNEAVDVANASGNETGSVMTQPIFTDSIFYRKLGAGYIEEAFRIARAADPDALLFYNELGIERTGLKARKTYELIRELLSHGVPIDGVGLQSHVTMHRYPSEAHLRERIRSFAELGLKVNISELDVQTLKVPGDHPSRWQAQRVPFQQIVGVCITEPGCEGVTLWGLTDKYANDVVAGDQPFVFDQQYAKKPAYEGVLSGLNGALPVYGPNLVVDGNFVAGGTNWTTSGGTLEIVQATAPEPSAFACVRARTLAAHGLIQNISAISSFGQYAFSALVRLVRTATATTAGAQGSVEFALTLAADVNTPTDVSLGSLTANETEWTHFSGNFGLGLPANTTVLRIHGPPAGFDLCVSDVKVQALIAP